MLQLVKMEKKYDRQLIKMMEEGTASSEKIIPCSIRKCDFHDLDRYIDNLEVRTPRANMCRIPTGSAWMPSAIFLWTR